LTLRLDGVASYTANGGTPCSSALGASAPPTPAHHYRITVIDNGEPGTNDTYGILLDTAYYSGEQRLQGGNVQIR
jgi:hypothetical protein